MRLLHATRPDVHIIEIIVAAVIAERPFACPRLQDQFMRFVIARVRERRIDAGRIIFRADAAHKTRDDAPARHLVEHGEFLRDIHRIVHQRQRAAKNGDLGLARRARQRRGDQVGSGHQAIGGGVMFVDADAVEAELVRKLEFADVAVVDPGALRGIEIGIRQRHPGRCMLVGIIEVERAIGHQVEEMDLHLRLPRRTWQYGLRLPPASHCGWRGRMHRA